MINPSKIPKENDINTSFKVVKIWLNKLFWVIKFNIVSNILLGFEKTNVLIIFLLAKYSHIPKKAIIIITWLNKIIYLRILIFSYCFSKF